MKKNYYVPVRFSEEEYQILQTKKIILHEISNSKTIKRCLFETDFLKEFINLLVDNNQQDTIIQRQLFITIKLCRGILMEMSKFGHFPEKALEINQNIINEYIELTKKEAEEIYQFGGNHS